MSLEGGANANAWYGKGLDLVAPGNILRENRSRAHAAQSQRKCKLPAQGLGGMVLAAPGNFLGKKCYRAAAAREWGECKCPGWERTDLTASGIILREHRDRVAAARAWRESKRQGQGGEGSIPDGTRREITRLHRR
jgi:hypothetical protein